MDRHKGFTIWFTGLSGAGKSTISETIGAAISPYRSVRDEIRGKIERFVEVYVECSLEKLSSAT